MRRRYHTSGSPMGDLQSAVHFGGSKIRARIKLSLGAVRPNARVNSACNLHADADFVDSITVLAPQCGSAVHFGGPKIRARIALPCGAGRSNTCDHRRRWRGIDAEIDDRITVLAPPWESAVHFGGPKIRARIALPCGAGRSNTCDHRRRWRGIDREGHPKSSETDADPDLAPGT